VWEAKTRSVHTGILVAKDGSWLLTWDPWCSKEGPALTLRDASGVAVWELFAANFLSARDEEQLSGFGWRVSAFDPSAGFVVIDFPAPRGEQATIRRAFRVPALGPASGTGAGAAQSSPP